MTDSSVNSNWNIDGNNQYGLGVMQKLPYNHFEYVDFSLKEILNTAQLMIVLMFISKFVILSILMKLKKQDNMH